MTCDDASGYTLPDRMVSGGTRTGSATEGVHHVEVIEGGGEAVEDHCPPPCVRATNADRFWMIITREAWLNATKANIRPSGETS